MYFFLFESQQIFYLIQIKHFVKIVYKDAKYFK